MDDGGCGVITGMMGKGLLEGTDLSKNQARRVGNRMNHRLSFGTNLLIHYYSLALSPQANYTD
jgi:hypothetical protein